jgi:DNA-binding HxlR family transcriptional regulator
VARRRTYGSYDDGCAAAHALDLVGERWALIVVRELLLGPKRFSDLQLDIKGISPSALTQRLRDLQSDGIVLQRTPLPARVPLYELTPWGQGLEEVTSALSAWGVDSPALPTSAHMSADTVILAMRAHARPRPGRSRGRTVAIVLSDPRNPQRAPARYVATSQTGSVTVIKSEEPAACTVTSDSDTWRRVVFGELPMSKAVATHAAQVDGARGDVDQLLALCSPSPPPPMTRGEPRSIGGGRRQAA